MQYYISRVEAHTGHINLHANTSQMPSVEHEWVNSFRKLDFLFIVIKYFGSPGQAQDPPGAIGSQ